LEFIVPEIFVHCPHTDTPIATGLKSEGVLLGSLPAVAIPVRCQACGQTHKWRRDEVWIGCTIPPTDLPDLSSGTEFTSFAAPISGGESHAHTSAAPTIKMNGPSSGFVKKLERGFGRESRVARHSIVVAGRRTSLTLEDIFWGCLREIAHERALTLSQIVTAINAARCHTNLSSAIRVFILEHYCRQLVFRKADRTDLLVSVA
jgi:predicted DNA-binding ribbon-helix-helix protein